MLGMGTKIVTKVTSLPLSLLSLLGEDGIPAGGTAVPLPILLSQPGTNNPWSHPSLGSRNVNKSELWISLALGRETQKGLESPGGPVKTWISGSNAVLVNI